MAEERRCQAQRLCANNCGFFGSPATQNLCSKCYGDLQLKEQRSSSAKLALNQTIISSSSSIIVSSPVVTLPPEAGGDSRIEEKAVDAKEEVIDVRAAHPSRCLTCRRRVGLTGFKCRCGMTFCGSHRYPEKHGCSFDFKVVGRKQIAKANPVVKAEKLEKI